MHPLTRLKSFLIFCILVAATQHLFAQCSRQEILLKQNWRFITDPQKVGASSGWYRGLPSTSQPVVVPHTWNVMSGLEDYAGLGWYETHFFAPASWKGRQVRVKFAAVYHDAVVYLNGKKLRTHNHSGYTTFFVDTGKELKYGDSNQLVVSVSNAFSTSNLPYGRSFDWCNDGGIIRDVSLVITGRPSIRFVHITPRVRFEDTTAKAAIELKLWEEGVKTVAATIRIREKKSGRVLLSQNTRLSKKGTSFLTEVDLGKIHLWHFNDPFLYQLQVVLHQNGRTTDSVLNPFGCREIRLSGSRFLLNQEPVRLPGMEYMPSSHPEYGSAEPRWVMDSVVNMFKDLNVTISRFHWQVDAYMLDLMDEKGILLQAEIPWWQQPDKLSPELVETAKKQFEEMVERDYNHPCIFAWGISNEVYGDHRDSTQYASIKQFVKGLDSTRLVNVVSNETFKRREKDESFIGDLPTWNEYVGTWFGKSKEELPGYFQQIESFLGGRPLLITENGLCEPRFAGGDLRRTDDMIYHYGQWASRDYIAGCIYFSLNDYRTFRGEDGAKRFKARIHGITDLYLKKKPSYYVFKQLAAPIEIVYVKKVNNQKIEVEFLNKNSIPSYAVSGYKIRWNTLSGEKKEKLLPFLKPGERIKVELDNIEEQFSFDVLSPGGYKVTGYPMIY